jgi:hypothetical protein
VPNQIDQVAGRSERAVHRPVLCSRRFQALRALPARRGARSVAMARPVMTPCCTHSPSPFASGAHSEERTHSRAGCRGSCPTRHAVSLPHAARCTQGRIRKINEAVGRLDGGVAAVGEAQLDGRDGGYLSFPDAGWASAGGARPDPRTRTSASRRDRGPAARRSTATCSPTSTAAVPGCRSKSASRS